MGAAVQKRRNLPSEIRSLSRELALRTAGAIESVGRSVGRSVSRCYEYAHKIWCALSSQNNNIRKNREEICDLILSED